MPTVVDPVEHREERLDVEALVVDGPQVAGPLEELLGGRALGALVTASVKPNRGAVDEQVAGRRRRSIAARTIR